MCSCVSTLSDELRKALGGDDLPSSPALFLCESDRANNDLARLCVRMHCPIHDPHRYLDILHTKSTCGSHECHIKPSQSQIQRKLFK